ncbi:MAG: spermidine/putrescine ABC transporter substrate-binding protein, partial [Candidatus Adiutrix sp.]|nr:spermidine/putrescine ABC transporter substrate-binding protein [Candidatus Adiutrix sp.]
VNVRLDHYESNEEMMAKLESGGLSQYDIIVPSTYIMPSLKNKGLIQPLDHAKLPNLKNLGQAFTALKADPGNVYSIPYQMGTSGLVVRRADLTGLDPSWKIIFDPSSEIGSFVIFDTARDALGAALKYLGYSLNSTNKNEIEEAARLLMATKKRPSFLGFDGGVGGLNKVMSGIAAVAQVYNGETIRSQEEDPEVHYILPKEGGEVWIDLVAVPKNAPHANEAHLFINYLLDAQVGARLAAYNRYATPNEAARQFVPEADLNNPVIYPSGDLLDKLEYIEDLGADNNAVYDEAWTMIKAN